MKKYRIDDKGRVRLPKQAICLFKDNSSLTYDFNLNNSTFLINNNYTKPHHH